MKMKLICLRIITFSFFLFSLSFPAYSKTPVKIKLISYNIKFGLEGLDNIVKVLKKEKADVIALQEVDNGRKRSGKINQTLYIAEKLKMNHIFGPAEEFADGQYGNAIISRFPIQDPQSISLPKGSPGRAGAGEGRVALIATIVPDQNNHAHDFTFISTHFGVFNSSDSQRGRSGIILNQFINQPQYFNKPAFLAGDLNERFKYLKKDLTQNDPNQTSISNLYRKWGFNEEMINTTKHKNKQIDYILHRRRGRYRVVKFGEQDYLRDASDHTAISLVVEQITDSSNFSFSGEDLIIVPGLGLDFENCKKRIILNYRIDGAHSLGEKPYLNPFYISSGRGPAANKFCWDKLTEAKAISDTLKFEMGVDPSIIKEEEKSLNTVENAKYTAPLVEKKFPEHYSVNVVTSFYHMNRRSWPGENNNSAKKLFKDKFEKSNINFYSTERFLKPKSIYSSNEFTFEGGWRSNSHGRFFCDVNGDKRGDLVAIGDSKIFVALSNGKDLKPSSSWGNSFTTDQKWNNIHHVRHCQDVNGDGKADLWAIGNDAIMIAYSNGKEFEYLGSAVWSFQRKLEGYEFMTRNAGCFNCWDGWKHPRLAGDFNGDGLTDIMGIGERKTYITLFNLWGRSTLDQP